MARLHTAGNEIIARALGRGLDEGGRLDLGEMVLAEIVADDLHDLAAQHDGLMHGRTAQVQIAVAQAQVVVDVDLVAQLKRRGLGLAQDAQLADVELYVAGCDLIGLGCALTQLAAADNNVLAFQALGLGENVLRRILIEHQLQNAGGIAQVGKDDAALVAGAGDGAADGHFLTGHGKRDFAAIVCAAQTAQSFHISCPLYGFIFY